MLSLDTELERECTQLELEIARARETEALLGAQLEAQSHDMRELSSMTTQNQQLLQAMLAAQNNVSSFEFEHQKSLAISQCEQLLARMAAREVEALAQRFPEHVTPQAGMDIPTVLEETVDSAMTMTVKLELEAMEKKTQLASQIEKTENIRREIEDIEAAFDGPDSEYYFDDPM